MGNACDSRLSHNNTNDCDVDEISSFNRNFCTAAITESEIPVTQGFCKSIGDNEFYPDWNRHYTCFYNSGNNIDRWNTSAGCCIGPNSGCSIVGTGFDCKRVARRGRPKICCFRDRVCAGINQTDFRTACYDSNSKLRSCPKDTQDLSSNTCNAIVETLCSNLENDPTSDWRANWLTNTTVTDEANPGNTGGGGTSTEELSFTTTNPICQHALWRTVYGINGFSCNGNPPPNLAAGIQAIPTSDGLAAGRNMVDNLINTYISEGGNIFARPDQVADTEMNDLIWTICSTTPGLCVNSLRTLCSTITTADLIANPNYQKFCACYMNPAEYSRYTDLYNIPLECTPQCNQREVIGPVNENGFTLRQCSQSTCVIDNVAIDLYKSRVGSTASGQGLTFAQLCGSCGNIGVNGNNSGTCSCTLSNLTIKSAEATIGGQGIELNQQCSNSQCFTEQTDPAGKTTTIPVPCQSSGGPEVIAQQQANLLASKDAAERWKRTKILIIFIIIIIVLGIIWFIFAPREVTENIKIYTRDQKSYEAAIAVK